MKFVEISELFTQIFQIFFPNFFFLFFFFFFFWIINQFYYFNPYVKFRKKFLLFLFVELGKIPNFSLKFFTYFFSTFFVCENKSILLIFFGAKIQTIQNFSWSCNSSTFYFWRENSNIFFWEMNQSFLMELLIVFGAKIQTTISTPLSLLTYYFLTNFTYCIIPQNYTHHDYDIH